MVKKHNSGEVFGVFFGLSDGAQDLEDVHSFHAVVPVEGLEEETDPLEVSTLQARVAEPGEVQVQHGAGVALWGMPGEVGEVEEEEVFWAQPLGVFPTLEAVQQTPPPALPAVRTQGQPRARQTKLWQTAHKLAACVGGERDEVFVKGLMEVLEVAGTHGKTLEELEAVLVNHEPTPEELMLAAHVRAHWVELGDTRQVPSWEVVTMLVMHVNMHDLDELQLFVEALFARWVELRVHVDHHMSLYLSEHEPEELPTLFVWEFVMESLDAHPDPWHLVEHPHRPAHVQDAHRLRRRPDLHSGELRALRL